MKKKKFFAARTIFMIVLTATCWVSSQALADTFHGSLFGSWSNLNSIALNENGYPFWDNRSLDGPNKNAGFQIASLGGPKPNQFWSIGGAVDNSVYFTNDGHQKNPALLAEIAGNSSTNSLYAFNMANPLQAVKIFDGSANAPSSSVITIPYANYGFKLLGSGGDFYSVTGKDHDPDFASNFAFFRDSTLPDTWWVAIEDLPFPISTEGIGDYNDMIIRFSSVPDPIHTPEPASMVLLGSGLIALAGLARRKFRK